MVPGPVEMRFEDLGQDDLDVVALVAVADAGVQRLLQLFAVDDKA